MEAKLKIITETADISMEEAKLALELADGNVERALELVPYVEKSIVIIHGKFTLGRNTKVYGIFRLLGEGREGSLLDFGLAMSYNKDEVESPISASPEVFKKVIDQLFEQTENTQVHTFLAGFYDQIGPAQVNQIYQFIKENKDIELKNLFRNIIGKIWGSSEKVEVELETFLWTKIQCEKKGLVDEELVSKTEKDSLSSNLTIYLDAQPIISPIKGKTIDKFALNEPIPLKIVDERELGKYLGKVISNEFGIAVGSIKGCYYNEKTDRYQVEVEFGPKINGRFIIEPSVRLATYTEIQKEFKSGEKDEDLQSSSLSPILYLLLGMILMLLIFFIFTR
ncbi:hypothetical protein BBF96_09935 [Anoxybacter fermentans]|uniref:DUF4899 domain-containing protein n=1 Tax=Anoxybacter fermentans TaxID=1323375 RepID=A0A3Q9HQU6_9FIRM|nr:DUF4899 domain-containing protein [Anoxybacter fermentans]AZR73676.1 hypothetical protein BBF96_09935 [Anoxybacter fermentans]